MSEPQKSRIVKLKLNTQNLPPSNPSPAPSNVTVAPSNATPVIDTPRFKLTFGKKTKPADSVPAPAPASEKVASPKPSGTIKLIKPKKGKPPSLNDSKKRDHDKVETDEQETPVTASGIKKIKLTTKGKKEALTPKTPFIRIKSKGRIPPRPKGVGYDSEASDRELDPAIEENFILRMLPGEDCDYVRQAIVDKNWGKQGASVRIKFLQIDGRRAVVIVRNKIYAAILVDIPCIVESMKSWDKKAWYKSADICQMLLVLGIVKTEAEASTYPVPEREVDSRTWAYAHGLTPPMHWVRKRRFRKRTSTHTIEQVERQVEQLLKDDAVADGEVRFEVVDPNQRARLNAQAFYEPSDDEMDEDEDGEGEVDYDEDMEATQAMEQAMEQDLEAQFESYLEGGPEEAPEVAEVAETPASSGAVAPEMHMATDSDVETPATGATSKEESEEEDEDDDDDEDVDEDEKEQRADLQRQREEIAELETAIKDQMAEMDRQPNQLLRKRIQSKIQGLQADLELKKAAIGEDEDD